MKVYSDRIGSGTAQNPFRPKVSQKCTNWSAIDMPGMGFIVEVHDTITITDEILLDNTEWEDIKKEALRAQKDKDKIKKVPDKIKHKMKDK